LLERYVLSLLFFYYAHAQMSVLRAQWAAAAVVIGLNAAAVSNLVRTLLVLAFDVLVGVLLLISRAPSVPPSSTSDVLVPLAANFFYLTYNYLALAPAWLSRNLLPGPWQLAGSLLALYLGLTAWTLAIWAVLHLGRSFALLVSVRPIVFGGPYRYVRHPIYTSYVLQDVGLACAYGSILVFVLTLAHVLLTIHRARLEEVRLCDHSAEYREYKGRTGFLLPRFPN
jgi:protein-S-isoprenylcysteine O-methyltransferase Ste14